MIEIYESGQRGSQKKVEVEQRDGEKGNERAFQQSPADPLRNHLRGLLK